MLNAPVANDIAHRERIGAALDRSWSYAHPKEM
jgi:hypothetical protein